MKNKNFKARWSDWKVGPSKQPVNDGVLVQAIYVAKWDGNSGIFTGQAGIQNWASERQGPWGDCNLISYRCLIIEPVEEDEEDRTEWHIERILEQLEG